MATVQELDKPKGKFIAHSDLKHMRRLVDAKLLTVISHNLCSALVQDLAQTQVFKTETWPEVSVAYGGQTSNIFQEFGKKCQRCNEQLGGESRLKRI